MILENVYSVPVLAFFSALLLGWYLISILQYRAKLAKLGTKPRQLPHYLPFGFDTLWIAIQVSMRPRQS